MYSLAVKLNSQRPIWQIVLSSNTLAESLVYDFWYVCMGSIIHLAMFLRWSRPKKNSIWLSNIKKTFFTPMRSILKYTSLLWQINTPPLRVKGYSVMWSAGPTRWHGNKWARDLLATSLRGVEMVACWQWRHAVLTNWRLKKQPQFRRHHFNAFSWMKIILLPFGINFNQTDNKLPLVYM